MQLHYPGCQLWLLRFSMDCSGFEHTCHSQATASTTFTVQPASKRSVVLSNEPCGDANHLPPMQLLTLQHTALQAAVQVHSAEEATTVTFTNVRVALLYSRTQHQRLSRSSDDPSAPADQHSRPPTTVQQTHGHGNSHRPLCLVQHNKS
jgi:hypothetical protein